ncbi:MAG: hypothetical protein Q9224_004297 [Gallowayella concinna]
MIIQRRRYRSFEKQSGRRSQDQVKVRELMENARAKKLDLSPFAKKIVVCSPDLRILFSRYLTVSKDELHRFAKARVVDMLVPYLIKDEDQDVDRADTPGFQCAAFKAEMDKYHVPTDFQPELVGEFLQWLPGAEDIRVMDELSEEDRRCFLEKSSITAMLRQFIIWEFFYFHWLRCDPHNWRKDFQRYCRAKRFAEEDFDYELGVLVKTTWIIPQ